MSLLESGEQRYIKAINNNNNNKRVELIQRGIALWKVYAIYYYYYQLPTSLSHAHTFSLSDNSDIYCSN